MAQINIQDFFPWEAKNETVEVSDEVAAELFADKRYEKAHDRRMRRNKAYSLDTEADMEAAAFTCSSDNPETIFRKKYPLTNRRNNGGKTEPFSRRCKNNFSFPYAPRLYFFALYYSLTFYIMVPPGTK